MSKSYQAEVAVKNLGKSLGWKIPRLTSPERMLQKARDINPERYEAALEGCKRQSVNLLDCSSWDILDLVYGLDVIFILPSGEVIGVDVTLQPTSSMEFQAKVRKLAVLEPLHKSLGVHRTVVFNPNEMLLKDI